MKPLMVLGACVALSPFLMAPLYYQGSVGRLQARSETVVVERLPSAVVLDSPLLITPTFGVSSTPSLSPTLSLSPSSVPSPRLIDALSCGRALLVLQDMASVAYQREENAAYVGLIVATALGQQIVVDGGVPSMESVQNRLRDLPWNGVLAQELEHMGAVAVGACAAF